MSYRLKAHSEYIHKTPTAFIDTDMLAVSNFDYEMSSETAVVLCQRSFYTDEPFNIRSKKMYLPEYQGMTLNQVYPYLACCTITRNNEFWLKAYQWLIKQDSKWHNWYGDQEALKHLVCNDFKADCEFLPESKVACLPEHFKKEYEPFLVHFKGNPRKPIMEKIFNRLQIA